MKETNLNHTKQNKQITDLRNRLEKVGWRIINESPRKYNGKLRWEIGDDNPNLIYTWEIQRNINIAPLKLNFIAWFDMTTYRTLGSDCSSCLIEGTDIELYFEKDKGYRKNNMNWNKNVSVFIENLLIKEKTQTFNRQ